MTWAPVFLAPEMLENVENQVYAQEEGPLYGECDGAAASNAR
jgi:hypothetical protein